MTEEIDRSAIADAVREVNDLPADKEWVARRVEEERRQAVAWNTMRDECRRERFPEGKVEGLAEGLTGKAAKTEAQDELRGKTEIISAIYALGATPSDIANLTGWPRDKVEVRIAVIDG